jgi:hypothetical protein
MALTRYPGFVGPSYQFAAARQCAVDECINFMPRVVEVDGKASPILQGTWGLDQYQGLGSSPVRALYALDNQGFVVSGYNFYVIHTDGSLTVQGTVENDDRPATICSSGSAGNEVFITSAGLCYVYNTQTLAFAQVMGLTGTQGAYLDGFFLLLDTVNQTFRISNYLDGLTWDPTQFRVRGLAADDWVAMNVVGSYIYLIGSQTYEIWNNQGLAPFPFGPVQGYFFQMGIGAQFSLSQVGESNAWLMANTAGHAMVVMTDGFAPKRISNHALEQYLQRQIEAGVDLSDAIGMSWQEAGTLLYAIGFPTADVTWVYDVETGMWHKRLTWVTDASATAHWSAWRPMYHMLLQGRHVMGDHERGTLWQLRSDRYLDADNLPIRRQRIAPHIAAGKNRLRMNRFELDMQVGIGLGHVNPATPGVDPQVMLRVSRDGGMTWGNSLWRSAGPGGEYNKRVRWYQLGISRSMVFEMTVSDPVPWTIFDAYIDPRVLSR